MRKLLVLLAAVAFVFAFTTPAAADVKFGGYVAFDTYMHDVDNPAPAKDSSDLDWTYDNVCSRLNVTFKEGPVGGYIEVRPNAEGWLRHWWGTWNFGGGTLGIGQFWTPEFTGTSSMLYQCGAMDALSGGGAARQAMIQLQFGGLKIAAASPQTGVPAGIVAAGYNDVETSIPKLMASYQLNMGSVGLKLYGGMNSIDARNSTTDQSQGHDSMLYGVKATIGVGPLTVAVNAWGGQNLGEYRGTGVHFASNWTGAKIEEESSLVYGFDLSYKVSDTVGVTAGYFTGTSELDRAGTWEWETSQMHVNATFTLAKGVSISPEYAVLDYGDKSVTATTTAAQQKDTRMGIYWKIAF